MYLKYIFFKYTLSYNKIVLVSDHLKYTEYTLSEYTHSILTQYIQSILTQSDTQSILTQSIPRKMSILKVYIF